MRQSIQTRQLKQARTCYGHFAGEFGVALTDCLLDRQLMIEKDEEFSLTDQGAAFFQQFGIDLESLHKSKRPFSKKCLDGTERKFHLGGSLGRALVLKFEELGWIEKVEGRRAILLTAKGKRGLKEHFHLNT